VGPSRKMALRTDSVLPTILEVCMLFDCRNYSADGIGVDPYSAWNLRATSAMRIHPTHGGTPRADSCADRSSRTPTIERTLVDRRQ